MSLFVDTKSLSLLIWNLLLLLFIMVASEKRKRKRDTQRKRKREKEKQKEKEKEIATSSYYSAEPCIFWKKGRPQETLPGYFYPILDFCLFNKKKKKESITQSCPGQEHKCLQTLQERKLQFSFSTN